MRTYKEYDNEYKNETVGVNSYTGKEQKKTTRVPPSLERIKHRR